MTTVTTVTTVNRYKMHHANTLPTQHDYVKFHFLCALHRRTIQKIVCVNLMLFAVQLPLPNKNHYIPLSARITEKQYVVNGDEVRTVTTLCLYLYLATH